MKDRYETLIEEGDQAKDEKERSKCTWRVLKILTMNHVPTIEGKINKLTWLGLVLLLAVLFSSKESIVWLAQIIMRLF